MRSEGKWCFVELVETPTNPNETEWTVARDQSVSSVMSIPKDINFNLAIFHRIFLLVSSDIKNIPLVVSQLHILSLLITTLLSMKPSAHCSS